MTVITANPWAGAVKDAPSHLDHEDIVGLGVSLVTPEKFGCRDLASDYYQVMIQRDRPKWSKAVWLIVILILLTFTGYMVYTLLDSYFQYATYQDIRMVWPNAILLPAVTVCSTNPVNFTAVKEALAGAPDKLEEFTEIVKSYQLGREQGDKLEAFLNWEHKHGSIALRYPTDTRNMMVGRHNYYFKGAGHDIPEKDWATHVGATDLGICIEINDDKSLVQALAGVTGGFSVELDAHLDSYLFNTPSHGFLVFIRNHDETVMLPTGGIHVSPGTETFIKLRSRKLQKLAAPWGSCENKKSWMAKYDHHYETVRECSQRQLLLHMIKTCLCLPPFLVQRLYSLGKYESLEAWYGFLQEARSEAGKPVLVQEEDKGLVNRSTPLLDTKYISHSCGYLEMKICNRLLLNEENEKEKRAVRCPEPCTYSEYQTEVSSSDFPGTSAFFDAFIKDELKLGVNNNFTYVRKNIAKISIFYDELQTTEMIQKQSYKVHNFIAEFGGVVDLFIGFSFFTVLQLVEIAVSRGYQLVRNRNKRRTGGRRGSRHDVACG